MFDNMSDTISKSKVKMFNKIKDSNVVDDIKDNFSKVVNITSNDEAKEKINDIEIFGSDEWELISKASSKSGNWLKSTKAMFTGTGCVIQVTTQNKNEIAEALTFIPGVRIECIYEDDIIIDRNIVPM